MPVGGNAAGHRLTDVAALLLMLALLPALVVPRLPASAATPSLSAPGPFHPGEAARVMGTGFTRNTQLVVWWDGAQPVTTRTNRLGGVDVAIVVPSAAVTGQHMITASYVDGAGSRGQGPKKQAEPAEAVTVVATIAVLVEPPPAPSPASTAAPSTPAPTPSPAASSTPAASSVPASSSPPAVVQPSESAPIASASPAASATPSPRPSMTAPSDPANAFVVAADGSDSNPGTVGAPWRTLQHAAMSVPAGGTVLIREGVYSGFRMTRSGTATAPITFASYPNQDRPVISGSATTVNVITLAGVHDIVLQELIVQGAAADKSGAGIRVEGASSRVRIESSLLRENRSYGVSIVDSTDVTVRGNEIRGNAEGVYIQRAGAGVVVSGNEIHHQDRMVVATVGGGDDHGGVGVAFVRTTGPTLAVGNRIWGNRAVSPDYGYDGGAFEIFAATNVTITGNVVWNNRNVIETGSDGAPCSGNRFTRNIAYGAATVDVSKGLVLRCAERMLIANNTFYRLDQFVFDIQTSGSFATSVSGLEMLNNIAVMLSGKVYGVASGLAWQLHVDHNLVFHEGGGVIGSYGSYGGTTSFDTFRAWTGFDAHGAYAEPRFVDASILDFGLADTSPAIDRALDVLGVTTPVLGAGPDIGRYESH
jgi:parallel beta-helix repeat protein